MVHGLPTLAGRGYVFEGLNHTSYPVEYTSNPDCMSHYSLEKIVELPALARPDAPATARDCPESLASPDATIEFSRDVVHKFVCPKCGAEEDKFAPVGSLRSAQGICPKDGQMRTVETFHGYSGTEDFGGRTLDKLGLPLFDIFTARSGDREISYLLAGDQEDALAGKQA